MKSSVLFVLVVAVTSICSGQWLERQVVIGDTLGGISLTGGIVVNPISGNVYIESDPIQVFNPVTLEKLRGPGDVLGTIVFCPSSNKGYVVRDSFVIVDATADTVIGARALPFPCFVCAYSPTANRLYVGSYLGSGLLVIDPGSDSILRTIDAGPVTALLWDSASNRVYVGTAADSEQLKVVDCTADTLVAEIQVSTGHVSRLALSTLSRKLYCDAGDTGLSIVSTDSLKVIGMTPALELSELLALAYNPVTDRLACLMTDSLCVIDCRADTIRARVTGSLSSVAVNTANGRTYLGWYNPTEVLVTDTNDQLARVIPIPTVPTHAIAALAFWPGSNELYGVTSRDLAFTIDASVDSLAGVVSYAAYLPRKMVHNPAGNKLYLLCPGHGEILVVDSTLGTPRHILGGVSSTTAQAVLNPALNRLYVADDDMLRVIDCNSDSRIDDLHMHGVNWPVPVLVPYLNKLYVFFSITGAGDSVYVYDGLEGTVRSVAYLTGTAPSAVYDPRSNRVFFASEEAPTVRALDPVTDSVVKTFDLPGGSNYIRLALNPDLGRLYYRTSGAMYTIDVLADSVLALASLPENIDAMFLNRRLQKLYLCGYAQTFVFDCVQGGILDTIDAEIDYSGLMNDRNDKLYLRYGAVVDCRYDSVVTQLDSINPRSMAWDAIDNRVFQATTSRLYVYRDDPYGIEEQKLRPLGPMLTVLGNPARASLGLRLQIPHGQTGSLTVYDAAGRRVHSSSGLRTSSFDIDVRSMSAGIYFIRLRTGMDDVTAKVVVER